MHRVGHEAGSSPGTPARGWYADPQGARLLRWWDGQAWTDETRRSSPTERLGAVGRRIPDWLVRPLVVADTVAAVTAGAIVLISVAGRTIPGIWVLLVPAVPLLIAGQLFLIAALNDRVRPVPGPWYERWFARMRLQSNPRRLWFGHLPRLTGYCILALGFGAWLAVVTARFGQPIGNLITRTSGCRWGVDDGGSVECISRSAYERVRANEQQFAAAVLAFFFVLHAGVAADELVRRNAAPGSTTGVPFGT